MKRHTVVCVNNIELQMDLQGYQMISVQKKDEKKRVRKQWRKTEE